MSTKLDARGVPVSYGDADALASFERALLAFQSFRGEPVAEIKPVLAEHPNFALGHLLRAFALLGASERRFTQAAQRSIDQVETLSVSLNDRERALLSAAKAIAADAWQLACSTLDALLAEHPTDALALQVAHLLDFLRGDALNLRNRIARVLPHWGEDLPGYGYVLSKHAFGLEESNDYSRAEEQSLRALDINPADVWAIHARVHVMEMQGRVAEGIDFLENRQADWADDNNFALHNWWHLCLFYLDQGNHARVLQIYDAQLADNADDFAVALVDLTALLWRLRLLDVPIADRMKAVAEVWRSKLDAEAGYYAFNDYHAAMAFADVGDFDSLQQLKSQVENSDATADLREMNTRVGLPLVDAWTRYASGEFADAADAFAAARDGAVIAGGSHAQRDVITLSLIEAARRAGQRSRARHYLSDRLTATPDSGLASRLLDRISA